MTIRLIPLDCPTCGSSMAGETTDVVFFCTHCGGAALLEGDGLAPQRSTAFLPTPGRVARVWRPAWVLRARVEVRDRVVAGGGPPTGWVEDRLFVVPAFGLALRDRVRLGRALTVAAPEAGEVPKEPVRGGTLRLEDVAVLARHMIVGDEIRRPDMLTSLTVHVEPLEHRLAAVPFERSQGGLRCAVTGVEVTATSS